MTNVTCWQSQHDEQTDLSVWQSVPSTPWLQWVDGELVLVLPPGQRGSVNGLPVVGGLQVVGSGDLVRVKAPGGSATAFVVGEVQSRSEPGNGRNCHFCGLAIRGEAVRCACGRLFCSAIRKTYDRCPRCGRQFQAATRPSERLL